MKITAIRATPVTIPLKVPLASLVRCTLWDESCGSLT